MTEEISIEVEGKHISGHYVVKDGMVTVTASDGRTTKGVIEDSMLSAETLAKTLLLQLYRHECPPKTSERRRLKRAGGSLQAGVESITGGPARFLPSGSLLTRHPAE